MDFKHWLSKPVPIAPLITFRITFGLLMGTGAIRFLFSDWVDRLYFEPTFFFKYFGFHWVQVLPEWGMYLLLCTIAASALAIALGLFYRVACIVFLLSFSYLELIDASNYLNHYYLVILLAFLLVFLPAGKAFSLDNRRLNRTGLSMVPAWTIGIIILQLSIVYTSAGIAKINPDWLFRAMPLSIWLAERTDLPVLGYFFQFRETAFVFSWVGMLYDCTIVLFLLHAKTRNPAYLMVVIFHLLTKVLFNIGLFPLIMITSTLIFFPASTHERLLGYLGYTSKPALKVSHKGDKPHRSVPGYSVTFALALFFLVQICLPFRHWLYPGDVLWTEEGYRFSWRVMLVEKHGFAQFTVYDPGTGRKQEINNRMYLTEFQEKQMNIQPDFMLQYAHFLDSEFKEKHRFIDPEVRVEAFVALNGRTSKQLIDPDIDLSKEQDGFAPKTWILKHPL